MLYGNIQNWLGWPDPEQAFAPLGEGAKAFVEFAQKKVQGALDSEHAGATARVGVIAADPTSHSSEAPLALVCEFPRAASDAVLDLVHKLAWNLSRTTLLITLEPHRLIAWTCHLDPTQGPQRRVCELPELEGFRPSGSRLQQQVRDILHWVNLITYRVQQERPNQFPVDGRADALLLKNLRYVRGELRRLGLDREHCHDLLARVIFTQFLFQRKDSDGNAFFSPPKIRRFQSDGTLSRYHEDLASLLHHKADLYALFRWMDERFNGDLFPGKDGEDEASRNAAWRTEKNAVTKEHLKLVADLVSGELIAQDKQPLLWRHYSFDTIPLEFISSVYEEFLTAEERGSEKAYYTPSHLVDYVLDAVLPWSGNDWNLRVLDPCCGSGIFLVKAFQRLIHRWRRAHSREPLVSDLRPILANNLVGVDRNPEAVRVACFSLYLAMADAIEPKHYVARDNIPVFPRLRGTRLLRQDFFDEETEGIRTLEDTGSYDLVVGNAPWGDGSVVTEPLPAEERNAYAERVFKINATKATTTRALIWARANGWPVANKDIGPLFLAKAASLVKPTGFVAMVNTASLLYWRDGRATELRKKMFTEFTFEEVTNLSALRRELFPEAIGPACVVVFQPREAAGQACLYYYAPKSIRGSGTDRHGSFAWKGLSIEPDNVGLMTHGDAACDPTIWPALAMGHERDYSLVSRLAKLPTLLTLRTQGKVMTREGVIFGKRAKKFDNPELAGLPLYTEPSLPSSGLFLAVDGLPKWNQPSADADASTNFEAFKLPQLLIKQTLSASSKRFRAMLVKSSDPEWGVICSQAYVTVRDLDHWGKNLVPACIVYNSSFATYYITLTSSRVGHYIPEALADELISVPLPNSIPEFPEAGSPEEVDETARKALGLSTADWMLIEDFLEYTLPDVLRKTPGKARFPTQRSGKDGSEEPEMTDYARTFCRVVEGTFGTDKAVAATVFTDPEGRRLPVRMLTVHLDSAERSGVHATRIETDGLLDKLADFHARQLRRRPRAGTAGGLGFQRVAWFFHPTREGGKRIMNLTIVKPDQCRYWLRSTAMRDADQLAAAITKAAGSQDARA